MREVQHIHHAPDEGEADRQQRVYKADENAIDQLLDILFHEPVLR